MQQEQDGKERRRRNYKLLVDPVLKKGTSKVYRYEGIDHNYPVQVRDPRPPPRLNNSSIFCRREVIDLPVPVLKIDQNYVGTPPPLEVTISNLNDNTTESFLQSILTRYGPLEECKVFLHPVTNKHLGLARAVFGSPEAAQQCVSKLNKTSLMGHCISVFCDPFGEKCHQLFEGLVLNQRTALKEDKSEREPQQPSQPIDPRRKSRNLVEDNRKSKPPDDPRKRVCPSKSTQEKDGRRSLADRIDQLLKDHEGGKGLFLNSSTPEIPEFQPPLPQEEFQPPPPPDVPPSPPNSCSNSEYPSDAGSKEEESQLLHIPYTPLTHPINNFMTQQPPCAEEEDDDDDDRMSLSSLSSGEKVEINIPLTPPPQEIPTTVDQLHPVSIHQDSLQSTLATKYQGELSLPTTLHQPELHLSLHELHLSSSAQDLQQHLSSIVIPKLLCGPNLHMSSSSTLHHDLALPSTFHHSIISSYEDGRKEGDPLYSLLPLFDPHKPPPSLLPCPPPLPDQIMHPSEQIRQMAAMGLWRPGMGSAIQVYPPGDSLNHSLYNNHETFYNQHNYGRADYVYQRDPCLPSGPHHMYKKAATTNSQSSTSSHSQPTPAAQEDPDVILGRTVLELVIADLKKIIKKDTIKKIVETKAFLILDQWWSDKEKELKVEIESVKKAVPDPTVLPPSFFSMEGGEPQFSSHFNQMRLGLRACMPKLPSFKKKIKPPSPPSLEEESGTEGAQEDEEEEEGEEEKKVAEDSEKPEEEEESADEVDEESGDEQSVDEESSSSQSLSSEEGEIRRPKSPLPVPSTARLEDTADTDEAMSSEDEVASYERYLPSSSSEEEDEQVQFRKSLASRPFKSPQSCIEPETFESRKCTDELDILYSFLKLGLDAEDLNYLKESYNRILESDLKNRWINDTHWTDHPPTYIPPAKKRRRDDGGSRVHLTGSARTEGFYKVNLWEKLKHKQCGAVNNPLHETSKALEGKPKTSLQTTREARSNQRRLLTSFAEEDFTSTFFKLNQLKFRKKQLRFAKSRIHDWGLFALEPIAADEMVIEYVGEMIRPITADHRERQYEKIGIGSSYLFRVNHDAIIDATKCGNLARFINHSCSPNCYAKVITVEAKKKIVIYSKQYIGVNEEITYDYKFPLEEDKIPCLCGSPNCRLFLN